MTSPTKNYVCNTMFCDHFNEIEVTITQAFSALLTMRPDYYAIVPGLTHSG